MRLLPHDPKHHKLSPDWQYVNAEATDIRKAFDRQRALLASQKKPSKPREARTK